MSKRSFCVFGCRPVGVTLHSFPNPAKYLDRYNAWVKIVTGNKESVDYEKYTKRRVCDIHFSEAFKLRNNRISVDAIPTLYLNGLSANETPESQHKSEHLSTLEAKHSETVERLTKLSPTHGSSLLDSIDEVIPQLSSLESSQLVLVKAGSAQLSIPELTNSDVAIDKPIFLAAAESNFGLIDESPTNFATLGTNYSDAKETPIRLSSLKSTTDLVKPIPTRKDVQSITKVKQTKKCMPVSTIIKTVPENEQDIHVKLVRIRKKLLHYKTILNKQALELREARKWLLHPEVKQLVESLKTKSFRPKR